MADMDRDGYFWFADMPQDCGAAEEGDVARTYVSPNPHLRHLSCLDSHFRSRTGTYGEVVDPRLPLILACHVPCSGRAFALLLHVMGGAVPDWAEAAELRATPRLATLLGIRPPERARQLEEVVRAELERRARQGRSETDPTSIVLPATRYSDDDEEEETSTARSRPAPASPSS